VKIKVTFYFGLDDLFGKETRDIELRDGASVKDVLQQLCDSEERHCALFSVTGSINPLISILKNGKAIGDLNHILKERDWVDVVPVIGGG
jgi:sulfur carrier protein ThiS